MKTQILLLFRCRKNFVTEYIPPLVLVQFLSEEYRNGTVRIFLERNPMMIKGIFDALYLYDEDTVRMEIIVFTFTMGSFVGQLITDDVGVKSF